MMPQCQKNKKQGCYIQLWQFPVGEMQCKHIGIGGKMNGSYTKDYFVTTTPAVLSLLPHVLMESSNDKFSEEEKNSDFGNNRMHFHNITLPSRNALEKVLKSTSPKKRIVNHAFDFPIHLDK